MNRLTTSLLLLWAGTTALSAADRQALMRIDADRPQQTITGFGGFGFAATWGSNLTDASISTMFSMDNTSRSLGYNILRARISPDSVASWGADNWGPTIRVMAKARKATEASGRRFYSFASAWTPPAKFTSNGQPTKGYILESAFGDYTDYLNAFIHRVEREGTDVDYISLQNEPDWSPDYEGCVWSATHFINYLSHHAVRLQRPLIGPEYLGFSPERVDSILQNPEAAKHLAIVAGHIYGAGNFDYPTARQMGKEKWMTEFLLNAEDMGYEKTHNYTWDDAIAFGRVVNTSMLANYNAWVHYALKASYGMIGDGTHGTSDNEVTKRGYVLAHFAKYTTGTTRLHTTLTDSNHTGLTGSAYITAGGDTVVVMMLNPTTTSINVTYSLPFKSKGGRRIRTANSTNLQATTVSFDESSEPTISIPAKSVCTYLFVRSSERSEAQAAEPTPLFADDFAAYNGLCRHPEGWKVIVNGTTYTSSTGNSFWNSSLPRLMPYSPESPIRAGILLHSSSTSRAGQASYGAVSGHRLALEAGRSYRLIWHAIGYNAPQRLWAYITHAGTNERIASHPGVESTASVGGKWGSGIDNLKAVADTIEFTPATSGNYEIHFKLTYLAENAVNGACMAVVGGITVEDLSSATAIRQVRADERSRPTTDQRYFDLLGRPVATPVSGKLYLRANGTKVIFRP